MNIVLDARWIFAETSGIGHYTRELIRHLLAQESGRRWTLLFDDAARAERLGAEWNLDRSSAARSELVPWGPFALRNQWALPRRLRTMGADVFHSPNWMIPYAAFSRRRGRGPVGVVTIHDLIPLLYPHFTPRARKTRLQPLFRWLFAETVRRADALIVPSETTRRDLVRCFRLSETEAARIAVIPEAADERFRPPEPGAKPSAPTVLYVGRRDPYKNLPLLIEAFARLRAACPAARLRAIGPPDPRYPEAEQTARRLGVESAIEWSGHVGPDAVVAAYQQASVFAMPSRYEGFGLPLLEAMACGTPVVCSDAPALVEVAGGAALHVPTGDAAALAAALRRVLEEPALAAELRARGLARAARFSWRATAEATQRVYEMAARAKAEKLAGPRVRR
jgi:alpha-1,3-rhamnosyl/mannosyltransferase